MIFKRLVDGVCAPAERRLDGRIRRVWAWLISLFGVVLVLGLAGCVSLSSSMQSTPDNVRIVGDAVRYRPAINSAYWDAAATVEKHGYKIQHKIQTVEVVTTGLVRGPSGKLGFPYGYSATEIAGGTTGGTKIRIAVDENQNIYPSAMRHEWGHSFLQSNGYANMELEEIELRRMGL